MRSYYRRPSCVLGAVVDLIWVTESVMLDTSRPFSIIDFQEFVGVSPSMYRKYRSSRNHIAVHD